MGIGLGVGINRSNYAQGIFGAYQSRVVADGGVTEAGGCVDAVSALLLNASLLLIPSGYKANKLYSQIPTNGNGDFTWARTSTAIRKNSSGLLESMATGVPRLDYTYGSCPSVLLEPQRTNIALRSEEFDNASSWALTNSGTITANSTISPDGTQTADTLNAGANSAQVQQAQTGTSGAVYTVSIWVKRITGTGNVFLRAVENADTLIAVTSDWQRFTATVTSTTTTIRVGVKLATSGDAVAIWGAQIELGAYPTSYIPTTSSSATRVADAYSRSLSSIASGTAFINITDNIAVGTVGTHLYGPFSITGASLGLYLSRPNNQRLRLWTTASANVFQTTETNLKLAMTWNGTNVNVYQNGVKVVTNYAYALTNVNNLFSNTNLESSATIAKIVLFNSVLTDAECISLTS